MPYQIISFHQNTLLKIVFNNCVDIIPQLCLVIIQGASPASTNSRTDAAAIHGAAGDYQ
jgi:hypothetical protein